LFAAEEEEDATLLLPLFPAAGWTFSLALLATMTALADVAVPVPPFVPLSANVLTPSQFPSSSPRSSTSLPIVVAALPDDDDAACSLSSLALFAAMSARLSFSLVGLVGTLITADVLDLVGVRYGVWGGSDEEDEEEGGGAPTKEGVVDCAMASIGSPSTLPLVVNEDSVTLGAVAVAFPFTPSSPDCGAIEATPPGALH
jgi:hypothetical protein